MCTSFIRFHSHVLKGVITFFAGSDLYHVFNVIYKDLAVADVTGVQNLFGSLDNRSYRNLADNDINLNLGQKVGFNRNTSVVFGVDLPADRSPKRAKRSCR